MRRGWFPTSLAVMLAVLPAHADDPPAPQRATDVVIDIVANARPEPEVLVLPAIVIEGSSRATPAPADSATASRFRIDPQTGLMVPDFGPSSGSSPRVRERPSRTVATAVTTTRGIRIDPGTGLLVPDFVDVPDRRPRRPRPAASTPPMRDPSVRDLYTIDPATGLMIPPRSSGSRRSR